MPNPEELFAIVSKDKVFLKIDLSKGYWQVSMAQDSRLKTAFLTPDGQYAFRFLCCVCGVVCGLNWCITSPNWLNGSEIGKTYVMARCSSDILRALITRSII